MAPRGPLPAALALLASMLMLFLSILCVEEANRYAVDGAFPYRPLDRAALAWGGGFFLLSVAGGIVAFVLWIVQPASNLPTAPDPSGLAAGVGLVEMAREFVLRIHRMMLATGAMLLAGGLGLLGSASLVSDGTAVGPLGIPGKIWVVHLDAWQVQVTVWSAILLALALGLWSREYRWARRLRAVWLQDAPEV